MGYMRHDAIVVTGWSEHGIAAARDIASRCGLELTDVAESAINGYQSFLIVPDGSKEGWTESDAGDAGRAQWKDWARTAARLDPPVYFDWVHIRFGGDDKTGLVVEDMIGKRHDAGGSRQ